MENYRENTNTTKKEDPKDSVTVAGPEAHEREQSGTERRDDRSSEDKSADNG